MSLSKLVPEIYCSDFDRSLKFYTETLGFTIRYARLEERFAFFEREGAEIMIEQPTNEARILAIGDLIYPYGRGVNFQIAVTNVENLYAAVQKANHPIFWPLEEKWYCAGESEIGQKQFVIMDPDGYMLRFAQDLGTRRC
jgi:catechol 2,3-dioxygenase-like lactoylglutathione lyase family enzyme